MPQEAQLRPLGRLPTVFTLSHIHITRVGVCQVEFEKIDALPATCMVNERVEGCPGTRARGMVASPEGPNVGLRKFRRPYFTGTIKCSYGVPPHMIHGLPDFGSLE
jgi:hypothetical protein